MLLIDLLLIVSWWKILGISLSLSRGLEVSSLRENVLDLFQDQLLPFHALVLSSIHAVHCVLIVPRVAREEDDPTSLCALRLEREKIGLGLTDFEEIQDRYC
jgi:hypothetical protein